MQKNETNEYISGLDGLRGVAVLSVVLFHYTYAYFKQLTGAEWFYPIYRLINFGWLGVDLFFVISGFLITRILLNHAQSPVYYQTFYVRRVLRIFPIYYAVLFFFFIFMPLIGHPIAGTALEEKQFYLWTYTVNLFPLNHTLDELSHFWSLAVEEHFYLLWPVCIRFFKDKSLIGFCLIVIVASLIGKIVMFKLGFDLIYLFHFSLNCFDTLALGALLAVLNHKNHLPRFLSASKITTTFTVTTLLAFISLFVFSKIEKNFYSLTSQILYFSIYSCIIIQLIFSNKEHWLTRFLDQKLLRQIGLYSYGIYIYHFPLQKLGFKLYELTNVGKLTPLTTHLVNLACFIMTLALAAFSYHFFEKKFLALKEKFNY